MSNTPTDDKELREEISRLVNGLKLEHYDVLHQFGYADFKFDKKEAEGYDDKEEWLSDIYETAFYELIRKDRIATAINEVERIKKTRRSAHIYSNILQEYEDNRLAELQNQLKGEKE